MITPEDMRWIREEIKRHLNTVICGETGETTTSETEEVVSLFQNMGSIGKRPLMHPYGFVSRAPKGTMSVVAKMGAEVTNRFVIGHRDKNRPADLENGETRMYSLAGYQVVTKSDGVYVRHGDGEFYPLLLGTLAADFFGALIDLIVAHTHAAAGAPPSNALDFTQLKVDNIDSKILISTKDGGF